MTLRKPLRQWIFAAAAVGFLSVQAMAAQLSARTVPEAQQMTPAELVMMLKAASDHAPMVIQVGSRMMFAQAHISRAIYAGPGSQAAGLEMLEKAVASVPKTKMILI